jgi:hypothetical protein
MAALSACIPSGAPIHPARGLHECLEPHLSGLATSRITQGACPLADHLIVGSAATRATRVPLEKSNDFNEIIAMEAPGSTVYLNTWRDGQLMPRNVVLGSSAMSGSTLR